MGQGRHARPNENTTSMKMVALGATVIGASVIPLTSAGTASAATDAQWEAVAVPEAGGNWSINHSGDGMSVGGLQFQNASWQDSLAYLRSKGINTSSFPATLYQGMSNVPTKAQQMLAGEALLHLQGRGAWANGNGSGLSASMFDGGPIPAAVTASGLLNGSPYGSATPTPTTPPTAPPTSPPSSSGLPKPNSSTPSAVPLQEQLKRTGYLAASVKTDPNYGPRTQDAVARFHNDHPEYRWTWLARDVHIGPKGWAHLKSMKSKVAAPPATPPPAASGYVAPVAWSYVGDSLIVGAGGSMSRSAGGHSGLDLMAPQGTKVVSVASGLVVSKNSSGGAYGLHVVVKHADGKYTLYAHLSAISVSVGQSVAAGQQVGNIGSTGNSNGPHLHFEVRTDPTNFSSGIFLDPKAYLRTHGVSI